MTLMYTTKKYIDLLEKARTWGRAIAKEIENAISTVIPDAEVIHDSALFYFYIHSDDREDDTEGSVSIESVCESIFPDLKGYFYSSIIYVTEEEAEKIKDALKKAQIGRVYD